MKKILLVIFILLVASLTFVACGGGEDDTTISQQREFTITFDAAGGFGAYDSKTVHEGSMAGSYPHPQRKGYTFDTWYLGDTKFDFTTRITSDITLTAKWIPVTYTISYVSDEDISGLANPMSYTIDNAVTLKAPVSNEKYLVYLWYTDENYKNEIKEIKDIAENLTLYGKWVTSKEAFQFGSNANGEVTISGCATDIENVIIPESIDGKPVTRIYNAFGSEHTSLKTVIIPDSVTSIEAWAFNGCSSLESVTISNNVTEIEDRTFKDCTSLKSITIPNGVTKIGESAFFGCSSLESVTISNSVTEIGDYSFASCDSLTSITIPNGVTSIGNSAFYFCKSLRSVIIPDSVTSIGHGVCSTTPATIYCEAESIPNGWDPDWNVLERPVVWGYKAN